MAASHTVSCGYTLLNEGRDDEDAEDGKGVAQQGIEQRGRVEPSFRGPARRHPKMTGEGQR